MGFTYQPKTYDITFADSDLEGFEVKAKGLSFGAYKDAMRIVRSLESAEDLLAEAEATDELLPILAESITWWNWDDIEVSADSLRILSPESLARLATEWRDAIAGVSAPLSPESENGQLPDIPMEVLSPAS